MKTLARWVVACLGVLAFVAPWKFGTPVVTQSQLAPPTGFFEWVFFSWPNATAVIFAFATLSWLVLDSERIAARVDALFLLPMAFLATQALATATSINPQLSADTLAHFATCVLLFYAAAWYARDGATAAQVFGALSLATILVAVCALDQRHGFFTGGLAESRSFAARHLDATRVPRDLWLRMSSDRVFAWFGGYPNALAGYVVVTFAPTLAWIWARSRSWDSRVKWFTLLFAGGLLVYCLLLTGSRGGFVAFAFMSLTGLLCLMPRGARRGASIALAVLVLAGAFAVAQRRGLVTVGRDSLESRFDYWRGAMAIARDHFWLGTGPGTFGSIYPKYKTARTEEAQLVHNNYLEMWSDSGLPAFVVFAALWLWAIKDALRLVGQRRGDAVAVAVCAALAGFAVHSLVDFDLYVPGLAYPVFLFLGIVQGLKELPTARSLTPRGGVRWLVGLICATMVGVVVSMEGRSLVANFHYGQEVDLRTSNPLAAMDEIERAVSLSPQNAFYQAAAGDLAYQSHRFDEAIQYYQAAIRNDPFRAAYHWRLAEVEIAAHGVTDAARRHLNQAVELNPTNERYRQSLTDLQEKR